VIHKNSGSVKIWWGFLKTAILALLIYILFNTVLNDQQIEKIIIKPGYTWTGVVGGFLAFSAAIFAIFINWMTTDFGDYLHWKKVDRFYKRAFILPVILNLITLMLVIATIVYEAITLTKITFAMLIYSVVNLISLVMNAYDLLNLHQSFRKIKITEVALMVSQNNGDPSGN